MPETLRPGARLGGGPGGYVAAIRAGQLDLDTVLVEPEGSGAPVSCAAASRQKR